MTEFSGIVARHQTGLIPKSHANDAFVIAGGTKQQRTIVQPWVPVAYKKNELHLSH